MKNLITTILTLGFVFPVYAQSQLGNFIIASAEPDVIVNGLNISSEEEHLFVSVDSIELHHQPLAKNGKITNLESCSACSEVIKFNDDPIEWCVTEDYSVMVEAELHEPLSDFLPSSQKLIFKVFHKESGMLYTYNWADISDLLAEK